TLGLLIGSQAHANEAPLTGTLGKIASTYIHTQAMQQRRAALETWHGWRDQIGFSAIHRLTEALFEISQNAPQAANDGASGDLTELVISEDSK
ncbi:MAG: site-specific integrase, partial [Pseudomonas sp.]